MELVRKMLLWLGCLAVASSLAFLAACLLAPRTLYSLTGVHWPLKNVWDSEMTRVPEGNFIMGCDGEDSRTCHEGERPRRKEFVSEFWIDRTEVSNDQYARCVDVGACTPAHTTDGLCAVFSAADGKAESGLVDASLLGTKQPVVCVDADQARDYCRWRGKRLPSDGEWERAARGTDGRLYPWGNTPYGSAKVANIADEGCYSSRFPEDKWVQEGMDDGFAFTAPVGSFPSGASPCGALDMVGNVSEWVEDRCWYCSGPGEAKWVRGGSWRLLGLDALSYTKEPAPSLDRREDVGFRCAVNFDYY